MPASYAGHYNLGVRQGSGHASIMVAPLTLGPYRRRMWTERVLARLVGQLDVARQLIDGTTGE